MDWFAWSYGNMSSFNFEKLYDVGNHLIDFSHEEEYQHSSMTQYYYSAFHSAKEYYEQSFRKHLSTNDIHSTLIKELENSPFKEEKELGEKLRILRNNRNHADYYKRSISKNKAKNSKNKAKEIFSLLTYLKKHPLRLMKN